MSKIVTLEYLNDEGHLVRYSQTVADESVEQIIEVIDDEAE